MDLLYEQQSQAKKTCHILDISRATFNRHLSDCRDLFAIRLFIATKRCLYADFVHYAIDASGKEPLEKLEQNAANISRSRLSVTIRTSNMFSRSQPAEHTVWSTLLQGLTNEQSKPKISMMDWSLDGVEFPKAGTR
ncbi:hypothetical protein OK016_29260 [Vibrio chagasii]|nr:hypothetical protein [Vibrio chagasii]